MPDNLDLTATVVAGGQVYPGWEAIEVWREWGTAYSYMRLRAIENTDPGGDAPAFSLAVGDVAQGYLCGQKVIDGFVITRQVVYERQTHGVEIIVASWPQSVEAGTVIGKPGQYKNQTLQQIASAVAKHANVNVRQIGSPPGADLPFPKVNEHIGERIIDFILRLARWRNMFVTDDENGNLVLGRAQSGGAPIAVLQEGVNIERCRMVMDYQLAADPIILPAQHPGSDAANGTQASQVALTQRNPNFQGPLRPQVILADHSGNQQEASMAMQHAMSDMNMLMFEVVATVPGWLMPDGTLWILKFLNGTSGPQPITIKSPMLVPKQGGVINDLVVKGVKHMQDNALGTRTDITCCLPAALGTDYIPTTNLGGGTPYNPGSTPSPGNTWTLSK
jgi:prophage tail gpP-like protein